MVILEMMTIMGALTNTVKYSSEIYYKMREREDASSSSSALQLYNLLHQTSTRVAPYAQSRGGSIPLLHEAHGGLQKLGERLARDYSQISRENPYHCGSSIDFASHQSRANKSNTLLMQLLQDLTLPSASQGDANRQNSQISYHDSSQRLTAIPGRTTLNIQGQCPNAIRLRQSPHSFSLLARYVTTTERGKEYACRHCHTSFSRVEAMITPGREADRLWISAEGLFKSHTERTSLRPERWTCIWPPIQGEPSCFSGFARKKELLQHLKDHHTRMDRDPKRCRLNWPADIGALARNPADNGFGAFVDGREMEMRNFTDSHWKKFP